MSATQPLGVAVIGAGFSGLALAHALNKDSRPNFCVFESASSVGGTWRENRYPGAACDVPSHLYSLSFAPNGAWTRVFPQQAEIERYLQDLARKTLQPAQLQLNWRVLSAHWDAHAALWRLRSSGGLEASARVLVCGMGGLHVPQIPDIAGRESFQGESFHSARWPQHFDLTKRRVAVIGSGASAVQIVPAIAAQVGQLSVLQRSPTWILPRPDGAIAPWLRTVFTRFASARLVARFLIYALLEVTSLAFRFPRLGALGGLLAKAHLRSQVASPSLRDTLRPSYPIGCKRVLLSSDYYPSLQRANVELVTEAIAQIEPNGVRLDDGRLLEVDTLIWATGFRPLDIVSSVDIRGRDGRELKAEWASRPHSYFGVAVHGYPNLFFLLGPNSALGHNSVLLMIEAQARYIVRALKLLEDQRSIEVSDAAQARFMQQIDRHFPGTVWARGCRSWYLNERGENIALWLGTTLAYRWQLRQLKRRDFEVKP